MILGLSLIFLTSCAAKNKSIIGVLGKDFGEVGADFKACDVPAGYVCMSPKVLDEVVESKIEELK